MISAINPVMNNMYNPYSMGMSGMYGMYNPYMMMGPQNMQQYKNMQKLSAEMTTKQVNFMGKVNPFFGTKDKIFDFQKQMVNYQSNLSNIYSPYANQNIASTKQMMNTSLDYQQQMLTNSMYMNPFSLGMGCPMMI